MRSKVLFMTPVLLTGFVLSLGAYQKVAGARDNKPSVREVEIPAGASLPIRLNQALDTHRNRAGDSFPAVLMSPVMVNGKVAIPKGTPFRGHLTAAKPSGRLRGRGFMTVKLDSFELNGQSYPITTSSQSRTTASHKKRNWYWMGGGSGFGALVGGLAGGLKGALIGGPAGAAAGTAGAALTGKKQVHFAAETPLTFSLREPVQVKALSVL